MAKDLDKNELYESVKSLVECADSHVHLNQHKLFTLFSIGFQYLLYLSTKEPGAYIVRIENSQLAEKLARKSKDYSTRKFLQSMLLPRKLKYQKSTFFLDFFHIGSWNMTSEIPKEKIKGAIIVKGTQNNPLQGIMEPEPEENTDFEQFNFPEDYYYTSLKENSPSTIVIAFEKDFDGTTKLQFPFIKEDRPKNLKGVTISQDIKWEDIDSED